VYVGMGIAVKWLRGEDVLWKRNRFIVNYTCSSSNRNRWVSMSFLEMLITLPSIIGTNCREKRTQYNPDDRDYVGRRETSFKDSHRGGL